MYDEESEGFSSAKRVNPSRMSEQAERPSATEALSTIENQLTEATGLLSDLETSLAPVLKPGNGIAGEASGNMKELEPMSLVDRLLRLNRRIAHLQGKITYMRSRLEI